MEHYKIFVGTLDQACSVPSAGAAANSASDGKHGSRAGQDNKDDAHYKYIR